MNIETLLSQSNYLPVFKTTHGGVFKAAYRGDTTASLSVDYNRNVFYDFGTGQGGDTANLYRLIHNCTLAEALSALKPSDAFSSTKEYNHSPCEVKVAEKARKCPITVLSARAIRPTDATGRYLLDKRGLSYWEGIYHVTYTNGNDKQFFGIGWQSVDGGWHIRSLTSGKFCTSQSVTRVTKGQPDYGLIITESMLDYLSLCQLYPAYKFYNAIILNSVTNARKIVDIAKEYEAVYLLLDNDNAGDKATSELLTALPNATDNRDWFAPHNDINDYLLNKQKIKL